MTTFAAQLEAALEPITLDELALPLLSLARLTASDEDAEQVRLTLTLGLPCSRLHPSLREAVEGALGPLLAGRRLALTLQTRVQSHRAQNDMPALGQVANVIAVASGKGGVGKSTTAVNLALALQAQGARVGVLDADIFGPSLPLMLGKPEGTRPQVKEGKYFVPVEAMGLQTMSMGYLTTKQTPVVWRGPKASGALLQMMEQTLWQELDYLLVDLPPGTGDIQLTLAQKIPVAGAVVVTTPQDIALLDAVKGIEMFRKVGIQVLGIVENMSVHICSQCGHQEHVFGAEGGRRMAEQYQTRLLGSLPLSLAIRQHADSGTPVVAALPDSAEAACYHQAALQLAASLAGSAVGQRAFPKLIQH